MRTRKLAQGTRRRGTRRAERRSGFTLIELLTVIAIIGILVGLIVPAVMGAYTAAKKRAMAMDVMTLAGAIDKYKEKYGDYPPDGSSATAMTRHLRRVFPQIAATELTLLSAGSTASTGISGAVMDGPEALVFFLGGFSDDPVHPFTGAGGPFTATPTGSQTPIQYNVDRNAPLYEFKQDQLTLVVMKDPKSGELITVSNDEQNFGHKLPSGFPGDLMPVFRPSGREAPYVYFNSNTYATAGGYNYYQAGSIGTARPYKSDEVNTSAGATTGDAFYRYANNSSYQLLCAGLDDIYGGAATVSATDVPLFYRFPSGQSLDITKTIANQTPYIGFQLSDGSKGQLDNCSNFSEGPFEDSLE